MTGKERIVCALNGQWADCRPVMLLNFMPAARDAGVTMKQYRNAPSVIAKVHIEAVEKYDLDGLLLEIDTAVLADAVSVPVDYPEDDPARCHLPCLNSLKDVRDLGKPDISCNQRIQTVVEACKLIKQYFKNEKFIRGNCDQAPFSLASMMCTPQQWLMDLIEEHNHTDIERLLEYCCDACCQFIQLVADTGVDMISNGDSPAGPELISPEMYMKFAWPYEKRLVEKAHSLGKYYMLHICGNTKAILDKMAMLGADAVELDYKTDVNEIFAVCHNHVTLSGNLDPTEVLRNGTTEYVEEKITELLGIYHESPRLIVNAGCVIPPDTPSENIRAMVRAAHKKLR